MLSPPGEFLSQISSFWGAATSRNDFQPPNVVFIRVSNSAENLGERLRTRQKGERSAQFLEEFYAPGASIFILILKR